MARPKIQDPRTLRITVRVTAQEFIVARMLASECGQNLADYARDRMLRPPRRVAPTVPTPRFDPETFHQIRKIGVNINQIAHRFNALNRIAPGELLRALAELRAVINAELRSRS